MILHRQDESASACLCSIIFCEAAAIYGVIVTIILQTKVEEVDKQPDGYFTLGAMFSGYSILTAGLTTGFANLACGCASSSSASPVHDPVDTKVTMPLLNTT